MGRDLTKRYGLPFERIAVKSPVSFLRDAYRYGKLSELFSFVVWEAFHRLRLFPRKRYLVFSDNQALLLNNERLGSPEFEAKINRLFDGRGLSLTRSDHNWKLLFIDNTGEIYGCLYPDDRALYKSTDNGQSIVFIQSFPEEIKAIFVSSRNTIFVCVKGAVYRSCDRGNSFRKSLDLSSSESFFRNNNAMTEAADGTLIIGEYGNVWDEDRWRKLAYLYFSSDNGETWDRSDFLIERGTNKHVHVVKYSKLLNKLFVADGDNKKKLWVNALTAPSDLRNPRSWKPVNRFHIQMGGYTSVAESDGKILFGTDYQGGTNFVVETRDGKEYDARIVPDPYRRSPIDNLVRRKSKRGDEIWANLPYSMAKSRCLLMYTADGGRTWEKVIEYSRATHKVWLISSSNETAGELYFSIENVENADRVVYKVADQP